MTQQAKSATPPSITIIDSTGVLDRNFMARPPKWAVIDGTRRNVAGVYGYFRYLQRLHDEVETDYIVHVCDPPSGGGDWRRNLLPGYKERKQKTPEHLEFDSGYRYEIEHVGECLAEGLTESPLMTLDDTVAVQRGEPMRREQLRERRRCHARLLARGPAGGKQWCRAWNSLGRHASLPPLCQTSSPACR